ncbi:MAG: hypothetical protein ACLP9L_24660 [Thermoguttaceae bacterium]
MKSRQISSATALVVGLVMAILGVSLPYHQQTGQTNGDFIIHTVLNCGGVLIALIAAFDMGRSSRK